MGRTTFFLLEQERKRKEKEKQKQKEKVDYEEKLKKYAILNDEGIETGWYDIPGRKSKIQGKEKAIEALKESDE